MSSFRVSATESGNTLLGLLRTRFAISRSRARHLIREGRVSLAGLTCFIPDRHVKRGQRIQVRDSPADQPSSRGHECLVRFADDHLVVADKPAGLTTMRHPEEAAEFGARAQRFLPLTLADILPGILSRGRPGKQPPLRAVHRLDRDTSGLVAFARNIQAERNLGKQFREHTIERSYLGVVRGRAKSGRIESYLVPDRGDGRRGSAGQAGQGKSAVTHVRVVEDLGDYTLVECRLETGRTHQVRIHLGESGMPLCGEQVYDRPVHGKPLPDHSGAPRLALHAARLGLEHPATGKRMEWSSPLPKDLKLLVARLRKLKSRLKH